MKKPSEELLLGRSRWVSIASMMSALALVGAYALVGVPNVELVSVIIFTTAYTFGFGMALWCTMIVAIVFGTFNPWGGTLPPILLAQMVGWLVVSVAGGTMKHFRGNSGSMLLRRVQHALAGLFTTVCFDVMTNFAYAWVYGLSFEVVMITGLLFMLVHVISNTLLFGLIVEPLSQAIMVHIIPLTAQTAANSEE